MRKRYVLAPEAALDLVEIWGLAQLWLSGAEIL